MAGVTVWNNLSKATRSALSIASFKSTLKVDILGCKWFLFFKHWYNYKYLFILFMFYLLWCTCTCAGLILNGGNRGNCPRCPWSLPWCPFNSPNRNLQIPHRGALCQGKIAFKYEVSGLHATFIKHTVYQVGTTCTFFSSFLLTPFYFTFTF